MDFYPMVIAQPAGPLVIVADAPVSDVSDASARSVIWQMSSLGTSDFVPRSAFRGFSASAVATVIVFIRSCRCFF